LLLNDHLLKGLAPGPLTGKLSDVCWLVVAPVVLGACLASFWPRRPRWLGGAALLLTGLAFCGLQLVPALGDGWCALFGGRNIADPWDLLCLPALALVPLCWRSALRSRAWRMGALSAGILACLATQPRAVYWSRVPCRAHEGWDPHAPLFLQWPYSERILIEAPGMLDNIRLRDEHGDDVPFHAAALANGIVALCPIGGLLPNTRYRWKVGPFPDRASNHLPIPRFSDEGISYFETGAHGIKAPISSAAACAQVRTADHFGDNPCHLLDSGFDDTADSAFEPADTADTSVADDTGDSSDTGQGADTGDSSSKKDSGQAAKALRRELP